MLKRVAGLIIGISVSLTIIGCGLGASYQEACNFTQNSQLRRISWKHQAPIKMYIHTSVGDHLIPAIHSAAEKWNKILEKNHGKNFIEIQPVKVGGANRLVQDSYSVIYMTPRWEYSDRDEQAQTTVYWTGSRISESDIEINGDKRYFSYFTGSSVVSGAVHFESLMVHEFGHVLGLAHVSDLSSVMQVNLDTEKIRENPSSSDIASLSCEYDI